VFAYPPQAAVNRSIAKAKVYAHAKPSKRIRELFVSQIADIHWKYKLSPETINLPARGAIYEIQIIELALHVPELNFSVIEAIERAIPFPVFLQFTHKGNIRYCASYKRPSESDASKWVIEAVFETNWNPTPSELPPLPVALDLASLYECIFRRHIPLPPRNGETLALQIARFTDLQNTKKLQSQLQTKLAQEIQFNRKVELNARLRDLASRLTELQR
jgi:hypothetical protein